MKNFITENTYELVSQLAKREGIEPARVIEIITQSFKDAYGGQEKDKSVEICFNTAKESFTAYKAYEVVQEVNNPDNEVASNDERLNNGIKVVNDRAFLPIDLKNLPKFIAYRIRKNIEKFIQEIRKEKQYYNFLPLRGEIVTGHIQSIQENFCIINLGKGLGYWDKKEWNFEDKNYLGKNMRFLLVEVQEKADLRQLVLSRRGESFLRKLFELEIPEIKEGIIEIRKVLRTPGLASKVIVGSENPRIDPVGACIGKQGARIKSIIKEVRRERIDLVAWNENKRKLLFNLISPVEVISIVEESEQK